MADVRFTPGPWEYVPGTEHHGPYVSGPWGGDVCDCYTISQPTLLSTANGGPSKPVLFQAECAEANAALIAAAPDLYEALERARDQFKFYAISHMAKDPPDVEKAKTNRDMFEMCEAALSKARAEPLLLDEAG